MSLSAAGSGECAAMNYRDGDFGMIKLFSNIGIDCFRGADVTFTGFGIALFQQYQSAGI